MNGGLGRVDTNQILIGFRCKYMVLIIFYLDQSGTMIYLICLLCKLALIYFHYRNLLDLHDKEER